MGDKLSKCQSTRVLGLTHDDDGQRNLLRISSRQLEKRTTAYDDEREQSATIAHCHVSKQPRHADHESCGYLRL